MPGQLAVSGPFMRVVVSTRLMSLYDKSQGFSFG